MKNWMAILGCSLLTLQTIFANPSLANEEDLAWIKSSKKTSAPPAPQESSSVAEEVQRFQVGGNYTYAWITPENNSTTTGSLGGVQAIYEYRPLEFLYSAAAFSWRAGNTDNGPTQRDIQDFNVQERLGYTFVRKTSGTRATLFTGFGARHLAETVTVGVTSIDYDYTEFYLPVGFLFENRIDSLMSIGCNFQWMPQIFPMVRIDPLSGAQWDLTYQMANFLLEIPLKFSFSAYEKQLNLLISPFIESWRDGRSTATTEFGLSLNLPGNTYIFTGLNVNLGICF